MTRKQMLVIISITALLIATVAGVLWQRRSGEAAHGHSTAEAGVFYCPMHPTVTSDKPGNCPICGMTLVRRTASQQSDVATQLANAGKSEAGVTAISLSPQQRVMANVRTMRVTAAPSSSEFVTTGRVTFDERRIAQVTSYTAGRIEQLYVTFTGDSVVRGRPVATIYSPDLYATQQEYVLALANRQRMEGAGFPQARSAADNLVESTRRRLLLFGMTEAQVKRVAAGGAPFYTTTIMSPVSGIVTEKLVVPQQYVEQGQALFQVAGLSTVWVEADVYEADLARIDIGQRVAITVPALPGVELPGTVSFIEPVVAGESRATRVRIELPNRNLQLKPDMYVSVKLFGGAGPSVLAVPPTAIIDRGQRQFVWVESSPGTYSPRQVTLGARSVDRVEIISGLSEGDIVVVQGAFLIDSEAQLRGAGTQG